MRFLGIDFGTKKTGIALGDQDSGIIEPLKTVPTNQVLPELLKLAKSEGITEIVLGVPVHAAGPVTQELARQQFRTQLLPHFTVHEVDERYSTKESQARQAEGDTASEDAIAAAIILEEFFKS